MKLVATDAETTALRQTMFKAQNDVHRLSLDAGALAGLLRLIAGNTEHLNENQRMAFGVLEDQAQAIENEIMAIHERLDADEALEPVLAEA